MKPGSRPSDLPEQPSDHFDGERFFNPQRSARRRGDLLKWLRTRERIAWLPAEPEPIPDSPPASSETLRVTWINHSTVLIQIAGQNILTDPVYSDRVSPFSSLGPRRHHPPGVAFGDLPQIDTVLISHAHYDHLDRATVKRLIARDNPLFIAGLGLKQWFKRLGTQRVTTIDWWQNADTAQTVTITGVPARHWSRRGLFDRNRSLWLGYWLAHRDYGSLYFAGDTGYGTHFRAIHDRLGPPTVALLPIGAYEPRWKGPIVDSYDAALRPKMASAKAQDAGLGHSKVQSCNAGWRDFGPQPFGTKAIFPQYGVAARSCSSATRHSLRLVLRQNGFRRGVV